MDPCERILVVKTEYVLGAAKTYVSPVSKYRWCYIRAAVCPVLQHHRHSASLFGFPGCHDPAAIASATRSSRSSAQQTKVQHGKLEPCKVELGKMLQDYARYAYPQHLTMHNLEINLGLTD